MNRTLCLLHSLQGQYSAKIFTALCTWYLQNPIPYQAAYGKQPPSFDLSNRGSDWYRQLTFSFNVEFKLNNKDGYTGFGNGGKPLYSVLYALNTWNTRIGTKGNF
jgi:hypothetical protein